MKTLLLTEKRKIEMVEKPEPEIKSPTDVLIRIKSVGVCGSDIHYFSEGKIGSQVVKFPFAIGHEFSGIVIKTGSRVTRVKQGDLIAVDPNVHCGVCDQCLARRPHTCRNNKFLGCPGQLDGCLCEYIVMPDFCCYPVNRSFDATQAALIEPLSVGTYSVHVSGCNFTDQTVGIFGAGPIGLSVLMVIKTINKNTRVFCFEPLPSRRSKALFLGADYAFDPFEPDTYQKISAIEPLLLDVIFDCSGEQKAIDDAIQLLKPGAKLVLTGIPPEGKYIFNMDLMRRKEITVINVRRQNHCVEKSIELVTDGLPIDQIVTHRFSPKDTQKAFDTVAGYKDGVIKAMIDFF
jgi:L-iditol 2-dehydrogenase